MKYIWGWGFIRNEKSQKVNNIDKRMDKIMNLGAFNGERKV